jgi:CelD/BcsL family acetyltransferase involved in cellulose biosynthesis
MVLHSQRWGDHVHGESDLQQPHRQRTFELARHFELSGALRQDWILWKDEVVAMVLGARFGATWFFYWAAISPAAAKYSPGNMLYMRILEEAFADGLEAADFMLGGAAYKARWSDSSPVVSTILQSGPTRSAHVLYQALRVARSLKNVSSGK